jgi:hypothetical protein
MKTCQICGKPIECAPNTRNSKYCKPCAADVVKQNACSLKRRQKQERIAAGLQDAMPKCALMQSVKHWECNGRRLPLGAIKQMVKDFYVDDLTVLWRSRTYQAQNGKLVEVKNG